MAISRVLSSAGTAGLIVSNRFMTTKSGSRVRDQFLRCFRLRGVWDLGDTKLFDAAVLPAVVVADGGSGRGAAVPSFTSIYETAQPADKRADDPIHALAGKGVLEIQDGRRFRVRHGLLDTNGTSDGVWRIATRRVDDWLATVEKNSWSTFGEIGKIRVGVKTCADKVFIRDDWAEMPEFDRPELLKPLTTHRVARRFKPLAAVKPIHILYPTRYRGAAGASSIWTTTPEARSISMPIAPVSQVAGTSPRPVGGGMRSGCRRTPARGATPSSCSAISRRNQLSGST